MVMRLLLVYDNDQLFGAENGFQDFVLNAPLKTKERNKRLPKSAIARDVRVIIDNQAAPIVVIPVDGYYVSQVLCDR